MQIKSMGRYMKTLSNKRLAQLLPVRKKGRDGKEKEVRFSLFSKEAQAEASRRRRKRERKMNKSIGGSSHAKAA